MQTKQFYLSLTIVYKCIENSLKMIALNDFKTKQ